MIENAIAINSSSDTLKFLTELYHSSTSGYAIIWSDFNVDVFAFRNDELEKVAKKLQELGKIGDTYVGRGLQGTKPGSRSRGKEDNIVFVSHLMLDADTREGPHGSPENPADPLTMPENLDEVLEILSDIGCPDPTMIVRTGGGYHLYWVYAKAEMIATEEQRKAEKKFSRQFQADVRRGFQKVGYKLDGTADLSRMCKAPGTFNHKTTPPKQVEFVKIGERIHRSVIQNWMDSQPPLASNAIVTVNTRDYTDLFERIAYKEAQRPKNSGRAREDRLSPIVAGCAFARHAVSNADRLLEPEWQSFMGLVSRTAMGREWAHACSEAYPGYTVEETDAKIQHVLADAGPATCEHIADLIGFAGCVRCPFRYSIRSPMNFARESAKLVSVQRRFVFVVIGHYYLDLETGETLRHAEFSAEVQHRIGGKPHDKMMQSPTTPKVRHVEYKVGTDKLIFSGPSGLLVNLWIKSGVTPKFGNFQIIQRFFERLIPDSTSRMHILLYIAHLYQFPGIKITHGIIITGDQGTGKSTVYRLLIPLFGTNNARKLEGDELGSKFNARLVNTQILLIEESQHGEKLETYERTKEVVTADRFAVEAKYMNVTSGYTPRGIFMTSNHIAPMVLPQNERRWFVARTADRPETASDLAEHSAFFEELNEALSRDEKAISAFAYYLSTIDLASFKPNAPPPMTVAKEMATEDSRTPLATTIYELIIQGAFPLHKDVVSMKDILYALNLSEWSSVPASPQKVVQALRSLGLKQVNLGPDKKHLELVLPDGTKVRPWAIRDVARWSNADRDALKAELMRPDPSLFLYEQDEDRSLVKLNAS
ncbi:primase-helicase family protein [Methylobacterium mesophilicum]